MEIYIQILIVLTGMLTMVVCLLEAFCIMFDEVFGTSLEDWFFYNDVMLKALAIAGMLMILLTPAVIIYQFK